MSAPVLNPPPTATGAPVVPSWLARSPDVHHQAVARAARPDFEDWVSHVKGASGCARPIRLAGTMATIEAETGRLLASLDTDRLPDGVIYKPCGNRRAVVCPSCSERYKRDAYQLVRAGLVGGKGVPEHVAGHPAAFPTLTAPSFGEVHTRVVKRHTCGKRLRCDCRAEPCHARRDAPVCPHGRRLVCFARHEETDRVLGTPLCLDCYDYPGQVVWNASAGELWRRTTIAVNRWLRRLSKARGVPWVWVERGGKEKLVPPFRLSYGKCAEMQRRGVVHYHAIMRLDGVHFDDPRAVVPPPTGLTAVDLVDAVEHAAATVGFHTDAHPARPEGWAITWGEHNLTKVITTGADGELTDGMVAAYLAKYATKSTEVTGHVSGRLTSESVDLYADPDGDHTARLIDACWTLGRAPDWDGLRRWAHMLGFGGHFLTKSPSYSVTFRLLRDNRVVFRRTQNTGPETSAGVAEQPTTLVVNFLQFVGAGWHTTADAMLANTSAAMAREHHEAALADLAALAA
ncbi:replication initiator [Dactylosporangium sp. AC04546]|uniref:replication initiator n=1 Tax=Dactylosporangium sp. AC04546 TaxID=2862460 RepID=UPI002E7B0A62|nr:replication initiator [Dactylosporangium sp. AC04546]WVK82018.1 replication initiator [Dactylosporangium sp. AC04546]